MGASFSKGSPEGIGLVVRKLKENSALISLGVRKGMQFLEIDGVDVTEMQTKRIAKMLKSLREHTKDIVFGVVARTGEEDKRGRRTRGKKKNEEEGREGKTQSKTRVASRTDMFRHLEISRKLIACQIRLQDQINRQHEEELASLREACQKNAWETFEQELAVREKAHWIEKNQIETRLQDNLEKVKRAYKDSESSREHLALEFEKSLVQNEVAVAKEVGSRDVKIAAEIERAKKDAEAATAMRFEAILEEDARTSAEENAILQGSLRDATRSRKRSESELLQRVETLESDVIRGEAEISEQRCRERAMQRKVSIDADSRRTVEASEIREMRARSIAEIERAKKDAEAATAMRFEVILEEDARTSAEEIAILQGSLRDATRSRKRSESELLRRVETLESDVIRGEAEISEQRYSRRTVEASEIREMRACSIAEIERAKKDAEAAAVRRLESQHAERLESYLRLVKSHEDSAVTATKKLVLAQTNLNAGHAKLGIVQEQLEAVEEASSVEVCSLRSEIRDLIERTETLDREHRSMKEAGANRAIEMRGEFELRREAEAAKYCEALGIHEATGMRLRAELRSEVDLCVSERNRINTLLEQQRRYRFEEQQEQQRKHRKSPASSPRPRSRKGPTIATTNTSSSPPPPPPPPISGSSSSPSRRNGLKCPLSIDVSKLSTADDANLSLDDLFADDSEMTAKSAAEELERILGKYSPRKLRNIPSLLKKFKGREMELVGKVRKKYDHFESEAI
eukprot:g1081.t1